MKKKHKTRFINLAEQLTTQNDIVNSTMDSMLKFVTTDDEVEQRPDFEQIQKTIEKVGELNPSIAPEEESETSLPRPKMVRNKSRKDKTQTTHNS